MFQKKSRIIVGLTTYYNDYLELSIPALARLKQNFTLIVHASNPDEKVTKKQIRALGYTGPLYIINSQQSVDTLNARLAILDMVRARNMGASWFMFVDDDDILANLDVPDVSPETFAIIQNMVVLRTRLIDVLRVAKDSTRYTIDNENVFLVRPHVGMAGTLVRMDAALRMADVIRDAAPGISEIIERLSFRAPIDAMMWSALNIVSHFDNPDARPIYMDCVNYIATDIDTAQTKYGLRLQPAKNATRQIEQIITAFNTVIRGALVATAAPVGA